VPYGNSTPRFSTLINTLVVWPRFYRLLQHKPLVALALNSERLTNEALKTWKNELEILKHFNLTRGRGSISKEEGHWPKGALLYMTRIKRFYDVHEPNGNFLKYGVSITSEMAFTESLLLRKGHFLSIKRGRLFKKYFFRSLNGAFKPRKKGTFFTFKKSGGGGHRRPLPPGSAAPEFNYTV
jgi:hypothetical protein